MGHRAPAAPIVAVDINPKRLALARTLGATHCIDNRKTSFAKRLPKITGGGVDYALDSTGDAALIRLARNLLNPGGRLALLTGGGGTDDLPGGRKVLSVIQGDAVPQRFIPYLIKLYQETRFPFDRLVSYYEFSDINQAIADAHSGDVIKAVLRFGSRT